MKFPDLLKFWGERVVDRDAPKPKLAKTHWSMFRANEDDLKKLTDLIASGRRLDDLMKHPGWQDILGAKSYYLRSYDAQTKQVAGSHENRLIAAATWSGLEGFFKELSLRIKAGHDAEQQLKEKKKT